MTDYIIRVVPGYGYLPMIEDENGDTLYHGEFQQSAIEALEKCENRLTDINEASNE